jgi:hypothetical protein
MKKYIFLGLLLLPLPAKSITWNEFWEPFNGNGICTKFVYREQYIPGNHWRPGYVRHWRERVRVPCWSARVDREW